MASNPYNNSTINLSHRERFYEFAPDWDAVTREHEYEDGSKSFNELNDSAPQRWELIYSGLLVQGGTNEAIIFDAHYNEKRKSNAFLFIDKLGDTHAVFYESFVPNHEAHKSWIQQRRVVLVSYPGVTTDGLDEGDSVTYDGEAVTYDGEAVTY